MDRIPIKKLSLSQTSYVGDRFSKLEIRAAVFGLGGDCTLSPDGFPIVFFQYFWDLFEDDMVVFFNEFHAYGVIVRELGSSYCSDS